LLIRYRRQRPQSNPDAGEVDAVSHPRALKRGAKGLRNCALSFQTAFLLLPNHISLSAAHSALSE
jgi:hypothetical protein